MEAGKRRSKVLYEYKELFIFLLFSVFCAVEAWAKGSLNEFGNIEFWLVLMGVVLLLITVELKANRLILLAMLLLMTVGNLVHACLEVYYYHDNSYKNVNRDYILSLIIFLLVMFIYPKFHEWLSSDIAIALMAAATVGIYVFLLAFGQEIGGVKAWFHGIQLTEPVKILFIFVIAGLLSKKQTMKRVVLALLYMAMNIGFLAVISEYGTLMIMFFVFMIFLFIFPEKWWSWIIGAILIIFTMAAIFLYMAGSSVYSEAMEKSSPEVFADVFVDKVRSIEDENAEKLSGIEILQQFIDSSMTDGNQQDFEAAKQQLLNGDVAQSDFTNKTQEGKDLLAALCQDHIFRQNFINTFCRDDFYGNMAVNYLYDSVGSGPIHYIKYQILGLYNKFVQRVLIPFAPSQLTESLLGVSSRDAVYQTGQAAKAMRIGGLTGAGNHEFIYVTYMKSDMVFSQVVSFFGFAMGLFVILMFMIMFREGIRIQQHIVQAPFHQGVALGISLMLFIQALVIIAGNMGVFPLTGITLPFIAEGSVSMYICVMKVALLVTISFIRIQERTGLLDALFSCGMRIFGDRAGAKVKGAGRRLGGLAGDLKKIQKEAAAYDEDGDDDIEEDESLTDDSDIKKDEPLYDGDVPEEDELYDDYDETDSDGGDDRDDEDENVSLSGIIRNTKEQKRTGRMHQSQKKRRDTIFDEWESDQDGEEEDGL